MTRQFLEAMIKLKQDDIIEFQLKISQFKVQLQQQKQIEQEQKRESNRPHCPFCDSSDIRKISGSERAVSILGLGLLSKKINKSFKCNKCGGTF